MTLNGASFGHRNAKCDVYLLSIYRIEKCYVCPIVSQEFLPRPEKLMGGILVEKQISMG